MLLSFRQEVFSYLGDHQIAENKQLYEAFKGKNKASIRKYKEQYLKQKETIGHNLTIFGPVGPNSEKFGNITIPKKERKDQKNYFIPLLKTYKLLPLYIFNQVYDIVRKTKERDYSIVNIYNDLVDQINRGNFNINDISDFTYDIEHKLKIFDHISWKKSSISSLNSWLSIIPKVSLSGVSSVIRKDSKLTKKDDFQEYCKIKAKILCRYLPEFYGIYYYSRKQELILRDFSKASLLNNITDNDPISVIDLVNLYNKDLEYRERPDKYFIYLDYSEDLDYLNNNEDD